MAKYTHFIFSPFLFLTFILYPAIGSTQSLEDELLEEDDFEIVEASQEEGEEGFFSRYIFGSLGIGTTSSDGVEREVNSFNIGIDAPLSESLRLVTRLGSVSYTNTYTQQLRNPLFDSDLPRVREISVTDNRVVINEAFLQWEATDFLLLSAGRERLAWGQFSQFSPTAFLLPFNSVSTNLRTSKIDFSYPQDLVRFNLFPLPNIEIEGYVFPTLRLDPSIVDSQKYFYVFNTAPADNVDISDVELPDGADLDQSAVRSLFYFNWGVIGLTNFKGYDVGVFSGAPLDESIISRRQGQTGPTGQPTIEFQLEPGDASYAPIDVVGLEVSIPVGRASYRLEALIYDTQERLNTTPNNPNTGFIDPVFFSPSEQSFYEMIVDTNAGSVLVNVTRTLISAGVEYQGTNWNIGVQFLNIDVKGADAVAQNLLEIQEQIEEQNGNAAPINIVPIISAFRSIGEEKKAYAGVALGALGPGFGGGFSAGRTFFERLDIGGFIGQIEYFDTPISLSSGAYESTPISSVVQIGTNFRF